MPTEIGAWEVSRAALRHLLKTRFKEMEGFKMGNWGNYGILWPEVNEAEDFERRVTFRKQHICDISYRKSGKVEGGRRKETVEREIDTEDGHKTVQCEKRSQIVTVTWPNKDKENWRLSTYWYETGFQVLDRRNNG